MSELAWRFPPSYVEAELDRLLPKSVAGEEMGLAVLRDAMRHGVLNGGKRLRPQLLLEAAAVTGGADFDPVRALPAACALELIHSYSLVHDDLPAMDDASTRRGRPTVHKEYGEANAILAGDALQTLAFEVLAATPLRSGEDAAMVLRVVGLIAHASGEAGMAGGQSVDISWTQYEGEHEISADQLTQMHALKTGALLRASAECGAILGGGDDRQVQALRTYGENVGRAFQIWDDVLDVEGDPAITGKASSDATNNKMTFTAVYGIERAKELAREASQTAISVLEAFGPEAETLRALARYVVQRNK